MGNRVSVRGASDGSYRLDGQIGEHAFAGRRRNGPEDAESVRREGAARDGGTPASSLKERVYALSGASDGDGDRFGY